MSVSTVHSEYKNITIRAGSADNELEHRAIVRLLEKTFGDRFPISGAYDPQFWKSHIGSRFVSLLGISDDKQIVGHLAYAPDRQVAGHVQVLFPFCDCSRADAAECLTKEFGRKAWQAIYQQAQRQNWQAIYFFANSDSKSMQVFAEEVMQASCVAILPYYLSASSHILVFEKILTASEISHSTFFVPQQHQELLCELSDNLKCDLSFAGDSAGKNPQAPPSWGAQTSDVALGLDRTYYSQTEVAHIFVKPSSFSEAYFSEADLKLDKSRTSYLFVDACDPACPDFCGKLEKLGLQFGGFFPFLGGQHNLVYGEYSKYERALNTRSIVAHSAKALARYVQDYGKHPANIKRISAKHVALPSN